MAYLRSQHHLQVVNLSQTTGILQHRLPRPLTGVRVGFLGHTTIRQDGAIDTVDGVAGILLSLTHGIAVLTCIAVEVEVVILIAKL